MPVPIFLAPTALVGIGLSKKAENKRSQAAANEFSKKYPLVDDITTMESYLSAAKTELKSIASMSANTAAARRVKNRNGSQLTKWTLVMGSHIKDLKSGMNMASSQVAPIPAMALLSSKAPIEAQQEVVPDMQNEGSQMSADSTKKGVNLLFVGGLAVAVFLIYKMLKK